VRSLRGRLIIGSCLIALLPVSVITFALSRRIESLVRTQAAERLDLALNGLQQRLQVDDSDIQAKIDILAGDPTLRRLYLVRLNPRELPDFLAERRKLLGLDFLVVKDSTGAPVTEGTPDSTTLVLAEDAGIHYESRTVGSLTGGLVLDRVFLERLHRMSGVDLVLTNPNNHMNASTFSDSTAIPTMNEAVTRISMEGHPFLAQSIALDLDYYGAGPRITGLISTEAADRAILGLKITSALLALLGLGLAILLGTLWSSQISRPVEELADFSRKVAEGEWEEPLKLRSVKELETLVTALDRMRQDLKTYRERLVTSERHAAWSQMARKVAHEVKNPLTPIAISVSDLKRSYEQQRPDFPVILDQAVKTIGEEVERLKHMLQEFSEFGRLPAPEFKDCRLGDLLADLNALYAKDVQDKRLVLSNPDPNVTFTADPSQLRQALVNLLQNGLEAVNGNGQVTITANAEPDNIQISVSDNGPGLSPEQTKRLFSPGFTTKQTGSGLGLVMVERIVSDHQGTISVQSTPGQGTTFTLRLPRIRES
jgi:signal transduction histidine kinase